MCLQALLHGHIHCLLWEQGGRYVAPSHQSSGGETKEGEKGYIPTLSLFLQTTHIEKKKI